MRAIVPVLPAAASAIVLARAVESAVGGGAGGGALGASGAGGAGRGCRRQGCGRRDRLQRIYRRIGARHRRSDRRRRGGGGVQIDASRRPAKPHRAQIAQPAPTAARHVAAHASASRVGSSAVGSTRTVAGAGAVPVRHVRFVLSHGRRPGGRLAPVDGCRAGERGSRADRRADGGRGWHGERSDARHGHGAVPGIATKRWWPMRASIATSANTSRGVHGWGRGHSGAAGHGRAVGHDGWDLTFAGLPRLTR